MIHFTSGDSDRWGEGFGDGRDGTFDSNSSHYFSPHTTLENNSLSNPLSFYPGNFVVLESDGQWSLNRLAFNYGLLYPQGVSGNASITVAKQYKKLIIGSEHRAGAEQNMYVFCQEECVIQGTLEVPGNLIIFSPIVKVSGNLLVGGEIHIGGQVVVLGKDFPQNADVRYSGLLSAPPEYTAIQDSIYATATI